MEANDKKKLWGAPVKQVIIDNLNTEEPKPQDFVVHAVQATTGSTTGTIVSAIGELKKDGLIAVDGVGLSLNSISESDIDNLSDF